MKKAGLVTENMIQTIAILESNENPHAFGQNWMELPQEAQIGWVTDDGGATFSPPPIPEMDLETYRSFAISLTHSFKTEEIRKLLTANGTSAEALLGHCIRMISCYEYSAQPSPYKDFVTNAASHDPLDENQYVDFWNAEYSELMGKFGHLFGIIDAAIPGMLAAVTKEEIYNILETAKADWTVIAGNGA